MLCSWSTFYHGNIETSYWDPRTMRAARKRKLGRNWEMFAIPARDTALRMPLREYSVRMDDGDASSAKVGRNSAEGKPHFAGKWNWIWRMPRIWLSEGWRYSKADVESKTNTSMAKVWSWNTKWQKGIFAHHFGGLGCKIAWLRTVRTSVNKRQMSPQGKTAIYKVQYMSLDPNHDVSREKESNFVIWYQSQAPSVYPENDQQSLGPRLMNKHELGRKGRCFSFAVCIIYIWT